MRQLLPPKCSAGHSVDSTRRRSDSSPQEALPLSTGRHHHGRHGKQQRRERSRKRYEPAGWADDERLGRLGRLIFPDVVIRIPDIAIPAPPSEVWSILIDFERYGEWNGFHRRMQVVDRPGGIVGLRSEESQA